VEYARVSNQPLSFQILFKRNLPERIHIDQDLMSGALKNGAVYRVVVVPYVQVNKESSVSVTLNYVSNVHISFRAGVLEFCIHRVEPQFPLLQVLF